MGKEDCKSQDFWHFLSRTHAKETCFFKNEREGPRRGEAPSKGSWDEQSRGLRRGAD